MSGNAAVALSSAPAPLLFDMDGVLIDNSAAYAQAWRTFLAEQSGLAQPEYAAAQTFGRRNEELFPEVFGRAMTAAEIARHAQRLESLYLRDYLPRMRETPGLSAFIAEARSRGHRLALATSAPRRNVGIVTGKLGLDGVFEVILSEADVRRGKPNPEIYLQAAARLGRPAAECVVFEDSFPGIAAGLAAGARCVALATSYRAEEVAAAGAQLVIPNFADPALPHWLAWR